MSESPPSNQADVLIWEAGHSVELFQMPQILAVRAGLADFGRMACPPTGN